MGKYIILTTFAIAFSVTLLARQGMQTDLETQQTQATRQKQVLARQIARSAFEVGMSELRRDFEHWRVQRRDVPYEGGAFDLTARGPSNGPVTLMAVGHYEEASYKITGRVDRQNQTSALFKGITVGGSVDFDIAGAGCSGGPCVSGIDPAGGEARHGISLPSGTSKQDREDVCDEFGGKIEGRGEGCDVVSRSQAEEDWAHREMKKLESKIQDKIQQGSNDVTVCEASGGSGSSSNGNSSNNAGSNASSNANGANNNTGRSGTNSTCSLRGNTSERGILYVKGEFVFHGKAQWKGPVYVDEGGAIRIDGGGGARNISGGLVMEGDTELDMDGGNRIQYHSQNILDLQSTMPSLSTEVVVVSGRSAQFAKPSE